MKKIILPLAVLISSTIYAQVGVNNTNPQATLDITAKTINGSKPEGLIAPRLTGDQIRLANAQYASAQTGTIVYATAADTAPAGKTANITAAGYYYFDGSVWQKVITGTTGDTTNDAWVNDNTNSKIKLGTLSNGSTARSASNDVVIMDNGNMGVGTTVDPFAKLMVAGNGDLQGLLVTNNTSSSSATTRTRMGLGAGNPTWGAINYFNTNNTGGRVSLGTYEGLEFLTYNTTGVNVGNIGIGTINPTSKLEVVGTSAPQIKINNTTNNWTQLRLDNSNSLLTGFNDGANISLMTTSPNAEWTMGAYGKDYATSTLQNKLQITNANTGVSGIVMESDGKVGIGTNTPTSSAILDVSSSNKGFLPPRVVLASATDAVTIPTPATGLTVYHTGNAGLVAGLYTNIGTTAAPNWVAGTGTQDTTNDAWVNDTANGIVKLGSKTDGTARSANTDVVANDSGYLGLGTSNPSSRISITGDGGANDDIKINSTSSTGGTGTLLFARSRGTGAVVNGDILGSVLFRGYDGANEIGTAGILATTNGSTTSGSVPTDLLFSTGSTTYTERMRITSSGNVGIGTASPGVKLVVTANGDMNGINLINSTSTNGTRTRFGIGAGNPNYAALYYTNVSSTVGRFGIGDYVTGNEYLSINTSGSNQGNVGIGTTTPDSSAILDVSATDKGFLPPRLALTGSNDITTIPSPTAGMMVYNTTTSATLNKGVAFYDGTTWKQLVPASSANSSAVVDLLSDVTTGNSLSGSTSGASLMNFGTITAPSDGSYAFSFRLYGPTSATGRGIFYIYLVKVNSGVETILDSAELNPYCFGSDATSYSVTLSGGSISQGNTFRIYIGRYNGGGATSGTWTLKGNPGNFANKTSFTWWKI